MRRLARLVPVLLGLALATLVGFAALFPITCTDLWWHLAAGRLMLGEGRLLFHDPFSVGAAGAPWIDLHWLFQVLACLLHRAGGVAAIVLGKAATAGLAAWVLLRATEAAALRREETRDALALRGLAVLVCAPALYLTRFLVLERPIVLTLLLLALFLLVLERHRRGARGHWLLVLLPLQVLWANCQGLFLLGPLLIACYLAGELVTAALARHGARGFEVSVDRRGLAQLALALGGVLAAGLLTPYGLRGLALPFTLLGRIDGGGGELFSLNVSENIPPFLLERTDPASVWHLKWVGAITFASFLLVRAARSPLQLGRLLLAAAFFSLALLANRNLLLFYWVAALVTAANLAPLLARVASRPRGATLTRRALPLLALAVVGGLAVHRWSARREEGPALAIAPFRVPTVAVERVRALGLEGDAFNAVRYGGYLAWTLHPRHRPFIDGRLVLRSAAQFGEYLDVLDHPERFEPLRRAHGLRLALLPAAYPDRYLGLIRALYRDPAWRLLYTDGTETLFARADAGALAAPRVDLGSPRAVEEILAALRARHATPAIRERAAVHLGRLLAEVGELQRAEEVLRRERCRAARTLLARVLYLSGQRDEAAALARRVLEEGPDAGSLELLALHALDRGEPRRALDLCRRALELDPYSVRVRELLERLRREAGP